VRVEGQANLSLSEYELETRRHLSGLATAEDVERQEDLSHPGEPHLAALRASLEATGLLDGPGERRLLQHDAVLERLAIVKLVEELASCAPQALIDAIASVSARARAMDARN
jgi:hypothetical protein